MEQQVGRQLATIARPEREWYGPSDRRSRRDVGRQALTRAGRRRRQAQHFAPERTNESSTAHRTSGPPITRREDYRRQNPGRERRRKSEAHSHPTTGCASQRPIPKNARDPGSPSPRSSQDVPALAQGFTEEDQKSRVSTSRRLGLQRHRPPGPRADHGFATIQIRPVAPAARPSWAACRLPPSARPAEEALRPNTSNQRNNTSPTTSRRSTIHEDADCSATPSAQPGPRTLRRCCQAASTTLQCLQRPASRSTAPMLYWTLTKACQPPLPGRRRSRTDQVVR